jgi:hypothetical protein
MSGEAFICDTVRTPIGRHALTARRFGKLAADGWRRSAHQR